MSTILLLDDEPAILSLISTVLRPLGHRLLQATSAAQAFESYADSGGNIDLLIADETLPVSSGLRVALELRCLLPGLRVVLISGRTPDLWNPQDAVALQQLPSDSVVVLLKPFTLARFRETVLRFAPPPPQIERAMTARS